MNILYEKLQKELAEAKNQPRNAQTSLALEIISKIRKKMSLRERQPDSTEMIREFREGLRIITEPFRQIPADQAYFWNKKTRQDMLEAKHDAESAQVREFSSIEEFMKGLDNDPQV
jgi:hypothetical protein